MNLEYICKEVIKLTAEVGSFIKGEKNKIKQQDIESKGIHDFVTYVDKTSEKMIVSRLKELLPDAGFIAEEQTEVFRHDTTNWIIDPLDGTTNYIHGLPPFAISIALQHNNEIVLGVVHELCLDECFYTWKDSPSYLNKKVINVTNTTKIQDALIATGFPYYDYNRMEAFIKSLEYFMQNSHGLRRLGSAATDLAYVACGRFEAFYEYSLSPWDVAAGEIIVKNAGGIVSDFSGGNNYLFGKEIIASNKMIFPEFLNIVNGIMNKTDI